jgi:succinoglycan biosynthesis transport protein ExoP
VEEGVGTSTLRDYVDVLWRRKWIVLQAALIVPLVAALVSPTQSTEYRASAGVLLSAQNLPANLEGIFDPTQQNDTRFAATQAELARVPEVANRAVKAAGLEGWSGSDLLGISSVSANPDSDILTFSVTNADPGLATRLANEYARQFTAYRLELDAGMLKAARTSAEERLAALEAAGQVDSPVYHSLTEQRQRLETMESLLAPRAVLVRPATGATRGEAPLTRNVILGLTLGIVLGIGLAFVWEALDSRVRSAEAVTRRLGLPLLGRIPEPPRRLRKAHRLVMHDDPNGPHAEGFRILRTNFEFANIATAARSVMLTSAVEKEGKSTTVANLALALATAGRRVTLIDLDLRSASLHRFFDLEARPGLTDVVLEDISIYAALKSVEIADSVATSALSAEYRLPKGRLDVLPSGSPVSNPGEFVARLPLAWFLDELYERSDIVLIDGPPLLRVGDAMAVSSRVDALLVVTRLNVLREPMLNDLGRILRSSPAAKLGLIVAGADLERGYGYLSVPYEHRGAVA